MSAEGSSAERLRELLSGDAVVHLPGVHDAVTARLAVASGARAACLSGAVASAVGLGLPDLGFVHGSQIAARARDVVPSLAGVPLLADADTGYGNALQARETTRVYAAAGIAGLHLEDQVAPKRCGHMSGKAVIGVAEAAGRVRAAVDARTGIVVVARTDALSVEGIGSVVERARAFVDAGADAVFVEGAAPADLAEVRAALGTPAPFVLNRSEAAGSDGEVPDDATLAALGVRLVIHPVSALLAATRAVADVYAAIARSGRAGEAPRWAWDDLTALLGLDDQLLLEERYAEEVTVR
ncbi:isocitrate lyase/PEP mutase family protein [Mumia sp. zg.B53]|uniref:isocitrate lyase/PEP mutase family protein n=1 Tax=unclassified Mumia TaxID=2621872 RepID=UPI001C6E9042|nr:MULTISPECIES: isocitrate lyase/PEP mutase family protein [unclassified Mumia]MBW9208423.1 isocitrate lyase/PEP mutase family protein [Mumia sp. zg.B21]MBW9216380.1 isocitrate lyase/PEP mutase family protein [Mumia sp. zg.B53]